MRFPRHSESDDSRAARPLFLLGDWAVGGALLLAAEKLTARSKLTYVPALRIARLYAHAREKDRALEWLEKAYEERDPAMPYVVGGLPGWDSLRSDPRFQSLLRRMNFPE